MNFEPPKRRYVLEQRPHDYVYDHLYTASSKRDFYKSAAMGARSGARIKLRPIYKSMFSELLRDRRLEACITIPQPSLLENFLPQYDIGGLPVEPLDTGPPYCQQVDPTGADRAKFFTAYTPESYQMARPAVEFDLEEEKRKIRKLTRRALGEFISRSVQTDYRESETQTDPYSPQHVLPYPGAYPKVLALIKLTWGKGLPATLEDIVVIERALTRRLLESGSRDVEDDADFDKRVKLMEELEAQQWADREKELNQIMVQKLDIVSKLLMDLKSKIANDHTMKLERAFEVEKKRNAKVLAVVKHDYLRNLRKLEKKYFGPKKEFKRDIIKEYMNFDSPVYAPKVRNGPNLDQLYKVPTYKYQDYDDFELFDKLTSRDSFRKRCMDFDVSAFGERIRNIRLVGKDRRMEKKLKETFNAFRMETMRKNDIDNAAILKQLMMNKINRLTTPVLEGSDTLDEQTDQAVIVLQKVIRGRAMQTIMRDEIKHNMDTVLEMKTLHKADPYGLQTTWGEAAAMRGVQKERSNQQEKKNEVTEISDQLEGETLGRMLDFLDKEMVRLLDERKIHALILLAERERRMREATEAGRRQKEEDNRHANDEVFRHIVGIHQSTVDIYLEDMYLETINRASNDNARLYVQELARTLNSAAYMMQNEQSTEMDDEEIAAELVHSFVMPEMNRMYHNKRLDALNNRYARACQQVTDATFSAQGVVREIVDSLAPTIGEHLERGVAAVDGTQIAIDQLIHEAVNLAIQQNCRIISPEPQAQEAEEAGETPDSADYQNTDGSSGTEGSGKRPAGDKFFADQDDFEQDLEEVQEEPEEGEDEFADDEVEDEDLDEDYDDEEYEAQECIPWEPIPVDPCLAEQLGQKSLQIKYRGEVGIDVLGVFEAADRATTDIFDDTKACLLPVEETDNESSLDEELDDDDDDSQ